MAKPKLKGVSIRRNKGGGHTVTHEYEAAPKYSAGGRNGGMSMAEPPPVEHQFPAGKHQQLMDHIAAALALKNLGAKQAPGAVPGLNMAQVEEG